MPAYKICAAEDPAHTMYRGTNDEETLFGSMQRVYSTYQEAQAGADRLAASRCWGDDGDLTAAEDGITYYVECIDSE